MFEEHEQSELMRQRIIKLEKYQAEGIEPFKLKYAANTDPKTLQDRHSGLAPGDKVEEQASTYGRIMAFREHGRAAFAVIKDSGASIQLYGSVDSLGEAGYADWLKLDVGDWIGASGTVFKTRRGELSISIDGFELLSKSLRPLPEKWHGLKDVETRYRQRYVDLIINDDVKAVFEARSRIISNIRRFLTERGFLEVETPMLQPIPGGATAKPFITHHNALDMDLYLRIAPELYLKRLIVGGFEKVFDLNKNFRNEGISIKHNPEFTMLEIYQANADYYDMMELTEELVCFLAREIFGTDKIRYGDEDIDLSRPWKRMTMLESIRSIAGLDINLDTDPDRLKHMAAEAHVDVGAEATTGYLISELFEKLVEKELRQPTFITDYPVEITPLARNHRQEPRLVERFELFIIGRETANAFSELIDPIEQRRRFDGQMKERARGDEEAHMIDEDFLRALEYGMPPTGGLGIGVDRLVMVLTGQMSIRDVILFPQLRKEHL